VSRQHGRRERPKPEQQAYIESLKKGRRARARQRAQQGQMVRGPLRITVRRRWAAVTVGTLFLVVAFSALLTAIVEQEAGNTGTARLASAFAGFLALASIAALGLVSRGPRPLRATLATGPAAIGVFLILGAVFREPATPLVAAFGLAAALTLRPAPGASRRNRITFVLLGSAAVALSYLVVPIISVSLAPLLPYFLPMVADLVETRRSGVPIEEVITLPEKEDDEERPSNEE
jgi:hypothetical protein